MKITRYFQSCLLIEVDGARLVIDPSGQDKATDFGKIDAVLYTHEHSDHFDAEMAQTYVEQGVAPVYCNASTAKQIKASVTTTEDGKEYDVKGVKVKAIELPHCLMVDGSPGPQNTGYLVAEKLFDPGDGKELAGLKVETLAVPITGPDISFKDAFDFAKQVGAKKLIPIHYDTMGAKPEMLKNFGEWFNLPYSVAILNKGQSVDIA